MVRRATRWARRRAATGSKQASLQTEWMKPSCAPSLQSSRALHGTSRRSQSAHLGRAGRSFACSFSAAPTSVSMITAPHITATQGPVEAHQPSAPEQSRHPSAPSVLPRLWRPRPPAPRVSAEKFASFQTGNSVALRREKERGWEKGRVGWGVCVCVRGEGGAQDAGDTRETGG